MPTLTEQQKRSKREGEAILLLALLGVTSDITPRDVTFAVALWSRLAPLAARTLPGAQPMNGSTGVLNVSRTPSPYRWNQDELRFVRQDGKLVTQASVKQAVNTFVERAADEIRTKTVRMNAGETTIQAWEVDMAQYVKGVHVAVDIVAQGGVAQVTADDVTRMGANIDFQLQRLLDFSREVSGELSSDGLRITTLGDDAAVTRAQLYAATARNAYEQSLHDSWIALANTGVAVEMQNILDPTADHCHPSEIKGTPGCPEESARGWVPIGDMSIPGQRTCAMNCRCHLQYRRVADRDAAARFNLN